MTRRNSKSSPRTDGRARASQGATAPPTRKAARTSADAADRAAHAAMAHEGLATPSGDRVKLHLTISLARRQAERLTARAIRDGKNLEALVAEILEAAPE